MKNKLLWSARILSILYILFISLFSLDAENLLGWIMHMIPSFVLAFLLFLSWKKPFLGSVVFISLAFLFTLFFKLYMDPISFLLIAGPLIIISALFYFSKSS